MNKYLFILFTTLIIISCKESRRIEVLSPQLEHIVNTSAKIEVLANGYEWSEGPLWLDDQQTLLWSDVPKNTIYSWKEGEKAKIYLYPSGYTGTEPSLSKEPGSNGLLLDDKSNLILCQHGNRQVAKMNASLEQPKAAFTSIAKEYNGKRFNSPNDAVYDNEGNLYFTDPPYGLSNQDASGEKELPYNGVYQVKKDGTVALMIDSLTRPNGIAFNPDFTKCYIANSDPTKAYWAVYDVTPHKKLVNGRIFFDATTMVATKKGLPDGLKVDDHGNLFATGPGGVLILSPKGEHLGTIATGEATANCAFNTDKSILFITADSYIMRVRLH